MQPIPGIDLGKVKESADKAFTKLAELRIADYLRGLKIQEHNERMKAMRLRNEADQTQARVEAIREQIAKIEGGDWTAIAPFEVQDGKQQEGKQ